MITVKEEAAHLCVGTLCGLFAEHGKEVFGQAFNLNLLMFARGAENGSLRFIVARDEKGEAIGYACFTVYQDGMRANTTSADCQAIYVKPAYRGKTSIRIIKTAEEVFKNSGIARIYMHIPVQNRSIARMFTKPKLGYINTEFMFEKEL